MILWLALLASPVMPARAGPQPLLTGPAQAVGDGAAVVRLELTTPVNVGAEDIEVSTDAGEIRNIVALGADRFVVELVAPRVATAIQAKVRARALRGAWQVPPKSITFTPPPFERKQRSSSGPFRLTHPERLLLGQDLTAALSVSKKDGDAPRLFASDGTVSKLRPGADGRLYATYAPPADKIPRMVVIVAVGPDGRTIDSGTIALWGVPRLTTQTAARAKVIWRLGGRAYGPLTASAAGTATMQVLAPPGVRSGMVVARDGAGNERIETLELGETPRAAMVAICPRGSAQLIVVAADEQGAPIAADRVELSTSVGRLSAPHARRPGVYEATLSIQEAVEPDAHVNIEARLRDDRQARAVCVAEVPGAGPERIRVKVDPARWVAGSEQPVRIEVALQYPEGRRPLAHALPLEVTVGQVEIDPIDTPARLTARWTLPDQLPASRRAVVTARGPNPRVVGSAELTLVAGPVERLRVAASRTALAADGESSTEISARAVDGFDNGRMGAKFEAHGLGRISAFRHVGAGRYVATYRSPASDAENVDELTIRDTQSGAETTLRLTLVPPPSPLWAGLGWASVGLGGFGLVMGAVTGGLAADRHATLEDTCVQDVCPATAQEDLDEFRALRTASTVGYVGGGIIAAAGVALLIFAPTAPDAAEADSGLWLGPGGVGTRIRF